MVKVEIIRKRINKLEEYLKILDQISKYEKEEFTSDPEHYGSAERFLQLAIETINDMANHVIAEQGLGNVNASRDLPQIFRRQKFISSEQEQRWIRMIGFRNILVHDYLDINRDIVHEVLQNELKDLHNFRTVFSRFL